MIYQQAVDLYRERENQLQLVKAHENAFNFLATSKLCQFVGQQTRVQPQLAAWQPQKVC